jgi:mitogen-activated protein kinase 1/3
MESSTKSSSSDNNGNGKDSSKDGSKGANGLIVTEGSQAGTDLELKNQPRKGLKRSRTLVNQNQPETVHEDKPFMVGYDSTTAAMPAISDLEPPKKIQRRSSTFGGSLGSGKLKRRGSVSETPKALQPTSIESQGTPGANPPLLSFQSASELAPSFFALSPSSSPEPSPPPEPSPQASPTPSPPPQTQTQAEEEGGGAGSSQSFHDDAMSSLYEFQTTAEFPDFRIPARYHPIQIIGSGSYGQVMHCHDKLMNESVAVKLIKDVFCNTGDARRILREIKILRNLRHDNIVPIMDIVTPDDKKNFEDLYIVFTRMDCDLLRVLNDQQQQLTDAHIVHFMKQMLKALKYMHSSSVIHRDIKPGNVLLTEDCKLRICDFGLARGFNEIEVQSASNTPRNGSGSGDSSGSSSGGGSHGGSKSSNPDNNKQPAQKVPLLRRQMTQHVATRWYRAPELILRQKYTPSIDVWSVGCIFGELLNMKTLNNTREAMFPGDSCMPLSPGHASRGRRNMEQLDVICNVLGTPTEAILKAMDLPKKQINEILRKKVIQPIDLRIKFPHATPESIDLLKRMLAFNPKERITVQGALQHPYLTSAGQQQHHHQQSSSSSSSSSSNQSDPEAGVSIDFEFEDNARDLDSIRKMILEETEFYRYVELMCYSCSF